MASSPISLRSSCLLVPKRGNSLQEYEDACASDEAAGRFAIADGASESIAAKQWAEMLVGAFIDSPPQSSTFAGWLDTVQKRWQQEQGSQPVPWYIEEKLRDGAFATFLGMTIDQTDPSGTVWRALAVGDCCLFRLRAESLRAFPIGSAKGFGTRPDLMGSRKNSCRLHWSIGSAKPGDSLFLMSDALAQWFLTGYEAGEKPWRQLEQLTPDDFPTWVEVLRDSGSLKNDDVTLLSVNIGQVEQ